MALVSVICSIFVCVVPLSQPSSRDLVYLLLGGFVSEKKAVYIYIKKKSWDNLIVFCHGLQFIINVSETSLSLYNIHCLPPKVIFQIMIDRESFKVTCYDYSKLTSVRHFLGPMV